MARTTTSSGHSLEGLRSKPVAVITPEEQIVVLGQNIILDGRQSSSADGEALTYSWVLLTTPVGSEVVTIEVHDVTDGASATLRADNLGPYTAQLTVSTPFRTSDPVTATVYVQAVLVPYVSRVIPDGKFPFKVLGDFWGMIDNREVFPVLWSGQTQMMAADLLRLYQYEYGRSIKNIQPWFQRRWISYSPSFDIDGAQAVYVIGNHQAGNTAFTPSTVVPSVGILVNDTEFIILEGSPSFLAVGSTLEVFTSGAAPGNIGTYTISAVNSNGSGYLVSAATPFPSPTDEILAASTDLVTAAESLVVESAATDFDAAGVVAGDAIRLETGDDTGYYVIDAVGLAGGLPNDRSLQLATAPAHTQAGLSFTVFKALRAKFQRTAVPLTDTVYIPENDANLDELTKATLGGSGSVTGAYEIAVEARHVFDSLIGKTIEMTSGVDVGRTFTISAVNSARTGYIVGSQFTAPYGVAGYSIPLVTDISDRLLILDGRSYKMISARLDLDQPAVADGGQGPLWIITLEKSEAPTSREDMEWRISSTLTSSEVDDFELAGVCPGDTIFFRVTRQDAVISGDIPCRVTGARGNKLSFEWGDTAPAVTATGSFAEEELVALTGDLHVPYGYVDAAGTSILTGAALEIFTEVPTFTFQQKYSNLQLNHETPITTGGFTFTAKAVRVLRNSKVPVADDLASLPALHEYIKDPEGSLLDGIYTYQAADSSIVRLPRAPVELLEGRDYSIYGKTETKGTTAVTEAGSDTITIPSGDLLARGVQVGDVLELLTGTDVGSYVITTLLGAESVKVLGLTGGIPTVDGAAIEYIIDRRVDGRFLYFSTAFTSNLPSPPTLWAETSFFDAAPYIEDNFGVLVGVTKAQLDEYGSSQISYVGAIKGLMYAWATGPTVDAITVGTHILTGLPVTEAMGLIQRIEPNYAATFGRILIEDVSEEKRPLGLTRVYYYRPSGSTTEEFTGLATNPDTGAAYRVGDIVADSRPLTKAAIIKDYVNDPLWWSPGIGAPELQKYHTWQIEIDATQIDSRDVALVSSFASAIREIETVPTILLELYLLDLVTITDELFLEGTLFEFDDPAFSLESTHISDNYNGGSLPLRRFGWGSFASRTLFEGYDLVQTAGSAVVTSARGGFSSSLTSINPSFPGAITTNAGQMVRAGDILFITTGLNRGRYEIVGVNSDNELTITHITGPIPPPGSIPAAGRVASTDRFYIERLMENPLISGTNAATDSTDVITLATANLFLNGITTDDEIVLETGADRGRYRILEVLTDATVQVDATMTATAGSLDYRVERYALITNPVATHTGATTTAGSRHITNLTDADLDGLRLYDELTPSTGTDAGRVFRVLDVPSDTEIVVDEPFTASDVAIVDFTVARPGFDTVPDSDWTFEQLDPWDELTMTIYQPRSAIAGGPYTTSTFTDGTPGQIVFTVDVAAAGATAAMVAEIQSGDNVGVYGIDAVVTTTIDVTDVESFPLPGAAAILADFLQLDADFDVLDDTVTDNTGANLEFLDTVATAITGAVAGIVGAVVTGAGTDFDVKVSPGDLWKIDADGVLAWTKVLRVDSATSLTLVENYRGGAGAGACSVSPYMGGIIPGDKFVFSVGTFVVETVVADLVTLTADTGVNPVAAYTGRFDRVELP